MTSAESDDNDPPLTVEVLADLQAGLLDDDTAARVRRQIRSDPQAAEQLQALQLVRADLAATGAASVSASAPEAPGAAHAARPPVRPARLIAGIAGLCAVVAAIAVGTTALLDEPPPTASTPATADHITVSTPVPVIPLSDEEIRALLHRAPDFGALANVAQRASCLAGLGYPTSAQVLGAQPVDVNARPGVVLVMPGDTPDTVIAYAVALNCSAADTGMLASTAIPR
ncbi:hypothetical protein [Mycobacterium asiaticum]|uniref:Anti-sigma-M factor RsmA n=1 Tax=Mycobacterium asiaticum TaxID=1790 RepID=A0A1A3KJN7_MYCAS|nr:hypothetical protein [Mycobacterium asiaticum]OBJ85337.1 hypothetical protein A5640_13300 [Mycobacterium asiaticum]